MSLVWPSINHSISLLDFDVSIISHKLIRLIKLEIEIAKMLFLAKKNNVDQGSLVVSNLLSVSLELFNVSKKF